MSQTPGSKPLVPTKNCVNKPSPTTQQTQPQIKCMDPLSQQKGHIPKMLVSMAGCRLGFNGGIRLPNLHAKGCFGRLPIQSKPTHKTRTILPLGPMASNQMGPPTPVQKPKTGNPHPTTHPKTNNPPSPVPPPNLTHAKYPIKTQTDYNNPQTRSQTHKIHQISQIKSLLPYPTNGPPNHRQYSYTYKYLPKDHQT
ncbi:hypothetical protein G9A89_000232 [Geosiphon pyriformis]|nr:hypothetical protein G9A89_000232 [Geosiphon pyriformis]